MFGIVYRFLVKICRFIAKCCYSLWFLILSLRIYQKNVFSAKVTKIEDNRKTNEVIIMGNGPSLKDLDFDKIDRGKYVICCVNYYPTKSEDFFRVKPEYLCLIDPCFYDVYVESEKDNYSELLNVLETVDWSLKIIAPTGKRLGVRNDNISYVWINANALTKDVFCYEKWWLFDNNMANPGLQNVVLGAMYFFSVSNFKRIYLSGVDFSEFRELCVDENNRTYVNAVHSYGISKSYLDEPPGYGLNKFYIILGAYQKMFFEVDKMREYANYKGIEIINLSTSSYIDSFRKESPVILEKI